MGRCLWDVDQAVNQLERIIREHLNRCMPLRTVSMSPRDPGWMTPLVKCMLRAKSRSEDSWKALNKRISEVIVENRRNFLASKGSCERWKRVDSISQRCRSMVLSLDHASLEELNDYFGELCSENTYTRIPYIVRKDHAELLAPVIAMVWNLSLKTHTWP